MGRSEGKGVKGAFAKEEWMGGKEVGESIMGCRIADEQKRLGKKGLGKREKGKREKGKGKRKAGSGNQ